VTAGALAAGAGFDAGAGDGAFAAAGGGLAGLGAVARGLGALAAALVDVAGFAGAAAAGFTVGGGTGLTVGAAGFTVGAAAGSARTTLRLSEPIGAAHAGTCARLTAVQRAKLGIFRRAKERTRFLRRPRGRVDETRRGGV